MSAAASQPNLRLAGAKADPQWVEAQRARLDVIKENRLAAHAAGLDPHDPRWILAMQTQARLQGATLTSDRRDQLMRSGKRLGMRPFETNLIIAIVQDRARIGQPVATAQPTLRLMRDIEAPAQAAPQRDVGWTRWFAAIAAAMAVAGLMLRWLAAGI